MTQTLTPTPSNHMNRACFLVRELIQSKLRDQAAASSTCENMSEKSEWDKCATFLFFPFFPCLDAPEQHA